MKLAPSVTAELDQALNAVFDSVGSSAPNMGNAFVLAVGGSEIPKPNTGLHLGL